MNKVYKVIWNTLLSTWVVASELAKGKQKSSCQGQGSRVQRKMAKKLANAFMLVGLSAAQSAFAADACQVGTAKELGAALNNNDCTDINLTANINLADYRDGALYAESSTVPGGSELNNYTTKFDFGTRTAITIDGGASQYTINNGNGSAYRFAVRGGDANNQVTFTIKNANLATTAVAFTANNFFVTVGDSSSNVNVVFDNIQAIPNATLALMSYGSDAGAGIAYRRANGTYATSSSGNVLNGFDSNYKSGYTYNQNIYSKVTVGTFLGNNARNPFNSIAYKQWIHGSKVDFTGKLDFYGTGDNSNFAYVFWNNTNDLAQNQLTFKTGSDVSFNLDDRSKLTTGDGNGQGYSYVFEDGSSFKLWSKQNVFGSVTGNNVGLQIGSYNKDTKEFGSGAKIIYAGVNGAQLQGDGITNLGGKNYSITNSLYSHSIINNGQYNAGDVIFNLAEDSKFNVTGIGINVLKSQYLNDDLDKATTDINNSGIYIRSATDIDAATGMNIVHDGSGEVIVKNTGVLTTTTSGITLSSASGNSMTVDMSKGTSDAAAGVINANSGTGITAGTSVTDRVVLNLNGGVINTSGSANAVTFNNPTNTGTHSLSDLIVTLGGSGNMLVKADAVKVALRNVILNINNRIGLTNLAGINFLSSEKGSNTINVGGTGTGIATTNTAISNLNSEALNINVNGAGVGVTTTGGGVDLTNPGLNVTVNGTTGRALTIADGGSNTTTIGSNVTLNAMNATAIDFIGNAAKTFLNRGTVKGAVDFSGDVAHSITNNGILDGSLTAGNGNNTLVLGEKSQSLGTVTLGNGNNNVTINNGALANSITTGSGNDTFTLNDLTGGDTYLGLIDSGTGTNTLNMNRSQSTLQMETALRGFSNINLNENTALTLASHNNITSGTVLLDNSSKLQFGNGYAGNFSATLGHVASGDGGVVVNNGANVTLANTGANAFNGSWTIDNGGSLTATRSNQIASSSGFALSGVMNLNGFTSLNNALTGAGTLNIIASDQSFNFGTATGSAFTGNVSLKNTQFALSNTNTAALQRATLTNGSGSTVTVGAGDRTIGNITLDGGTSTFDTGNINTGTLSVAQNSDVRVATDAILQDNLLDQDETRARKIINSTNTLTAGQLALLKLKNAQGNALSNGTQQAIVQNGVDVAEGTYNYALSGVGGGLTITAQLIKLALSSNQTLTLDAAGAVSKNFIAQISGAGNLALNAGSDTLTLNNTGNSYTGTTAINSGTVTAGSSNALGATSGLNIGAGAAYNLNGKIQTIAGSVVNAGRTTVGSGGSLASGALTNTGTVNITGGTMTLNNGGSSVAAGGLTGNGSLVVAGGELALSRANAGLAGNTIINQGAAVTLTDTGTLGSAAVGVGGTLNLNAAQTLTNVLSGAGTVNTGADIRLSADNTFSGAHNVAANSALTVSKAGNLGSTAATVSLNGAGSQLVLNALSGAVNNALSGVADSMISLTGSSNATVGGNNSGFLGIWSVGGNSTLHAGSAGHLGAGSSVLLGGAGNALNLAGYSGTFGNQVSGTGLLSLNDGADVSLNIGGTLAAGVGVEIADDSALTLAGLNNFNQALSGDGTLNVNAATSGNQSFAFGSNTGSDFAGQVNLSNAQFALSGNNTASLGAATLNVGDGSAVTVGSGEQTVGGLILGGGTTTFTSSGYIVSDSLDVTDNSIIQVQNNLSLSDNLLEQSNSESRVLVNSVALSAEDLAKLTLQDLDGNALTDNTEVDVVQSGATVAEGFYNFALSSDSGLSVVARLVKLALFANKTLELNTANTSDAAKTVTAQLTGSGNLALNANAGSLTLINAENDYTGSTVINSGTVVSGSNNALGNTLQLTMLANTLFDLNGKIQSLGALINTGVVKVGAEGALTVNRDTATGKTGEFNNSGVVDIHGGTLTLTNGGTSTVAGVLTGNGSLVVSGGELTLSQANANLGGTTTIANAAAVTLSESGTLGNADVAVDGMLNLNVNQTLANVLSGTGDINTNGSVTLSGESTFQGSHLINSNGTLTISQAANLGSRQADVTLQDATSTLVFDALNGQVGQSLSGVANSQINVTNGSNAALTGENDGFKGIYDVSGDSTLTASYTSQLGEDASVSLEDTGDTLNLSAYRGNFVNQVDGKGTVSLTEGSLVAMNSMTKTGSDVAMHIDNGSELQLSEVTQFNQALSGSGALSVNGGTQTFDFGANTGSAFTGSVTLQDVTFNLNQHNVNALANATLALGRDSITNVGSSDRTLNDIDVNGGRLTFDVDAPQSKANGIINAKTLVLNGGEVSVTGDAEWENVGVPAVPGVSILDQDKGEVLMTLINAGAVSGNINNMSLSINGTPIISGDQTVISAITQGDKKVADATYNYGLTSNDGDDKGLYIKYGLTALDLMTDGSDALLLKTGEAGSNRTLNALLSGKGGLNINASNGALTIANGNNSYTGVTAVNQGSLLLGADNALGQTSALDIKQGAGVSLNGFKQTVGVLDNSGTLSLDNGELVLSNGGQSNADVGLKGRGTLTVAGGDLRVSGANNNLQGNTAINSGASVTLSDNGNLGTSNVEVGGLLNLNAEGLTLANALSGNGRVNVNAATTLTGNSTFTGQHHVSKDTALTINRAANLGANTSSVNLDGSAASLVMNGLSGAIKNALSGVQDSIVALTNGARVQLTGNNDRFTGSYTLEGNSAMTVSTLNHLGSNASVSLAGALDKLILSGYQGGLSNSVAGNGVLSLADRANVLFNAGNRVDRTVGISLNRDSALTLSGLNGFDHALTGSGTLNVKSGGSQFTFGDAAGTAFAGNVDLSNTGLTLGNSNTRALTNANLTLSENSQANVSDGVQNIGGLTMNNGTLKFDNIIDNKGQLVSEGIIEADSIDVTGGGVVQINLPANVTPGLKGQSLLELDEGEIIVDLAHGNAKGTGQELTLTDTNGQAITQSVKAGLTNEGADAPSALGSFDYGLTTGTDQDGLYVNYGLKAIELLANGADALKAQAQEANNGQQSNGISSKISGSGDLAVEGLTDGAILSLNNGNNDYTGATLLRQGGLRLGTSNALGLTSELAMSSGTQIDINGTRQTVGQLNTQADSRFNLNGGNVTIKNGGQVDGMLTGAGQLNLSAGTLNVSRANTAFTGNTAIDSGAIAVLTDVAGLGVGNIANKGTLTLNGAQGTFANSLSETGNLRLQNKAAVQLSGNNAQYAGAFTLAEETALTAKKAEQLGSARVNNAGKLILDVASDWSLKNLIGGNGDLIKQGSGTLKLLESVVTAGNTIIENGIVQLGEGTTKDQNGQSTYIADTRANARASAAQVPVALNSNVTIQQSGALGGFGRVTGNVDNAGSLIMSHALTGNNYADFTINGNYVGQKGSRVIFDTVLAGDNSTTDRLVVNGDTSGTSSIKVNNIGGRGAYTTNGIRIVDIAGKSGANFELEGRVVAGGYDYKLYQGGVTNPNDGDWYLRTEKPDRPEAGSYIANLAAANTMFNTNLENRSGETWYTDAITGEKKATSMWLRMTGSHNRSRDSSGAFKTQDNRFVTQFGGDVLRFNSNEKDLWRVGLMAGYAESNNNTIASDSGSRSKGSAKGYSVGTYGTWFADEKAHTGAYVDSWLQYSWFKNEVNGEALAQEKYDSKGFTASVETGYTFFAGASEQYNFYLQPKAQAIWMGVKADDHREASNTLVSGEGNNNVQTRLGMKAFFTQSSQEKAAQTQMFKPYVEATWIHNSKDFAAKMSHESIGSHTFKQAGTGNIAEVKLGVEGDLNKRLNMWGNVGQQIGGKGYSDTTVTFGVKYNF